MRSHNRKEGIAVSETLLKNLGAEWRVIDICENGERERVLVLVKKPIEAREHAKAQLKSKGWTYRSAAPLLKVNFVSLSRILNGQYSNRRVMKAIENLPKREQMKARSHVE